ncbi:peroxisomal short-chain alcohol dehydrogenase [Fusarium mundagurra]|uniref:Peroxisomal short-chain alcohol dehydrogenase n=1 Tax=Fusarium mundagurra TaxID=1567541 RepID=A0A8H6D1L5_9HYPO|nr:peroxisomal short-chain alcohol dehydrogenase [Fusarium mundagurra]
MLSGQRSSDMANALEAEKVIAGGNSASEKWLATYPDWLNIINNVEKSITSQRLSVSNRIIYAVSAIDPSLPALQQTGRAVVVTGGNSGIGYAIARSFVKANAASVIILERRKKLVASAAAKLREEGHEFGSGTDETLESEDISVDVLVLSAASYGAIETILDGGLSKVWGDFESNVRSTLDMTERVYKQKTTAPGQTEFLVNISSCAAYMWSTMGPGRRNQIVQDTKPTDMQIVSFHPAGVLTDSAKRVGGDNLKGLVFDDENLPGHFSVWVATPEASFLHGRFVWANWDLDELKNGPVRKQIDTDERFLKVGVEGLSEKMGGMVMT